MKAYVKLIQQLLCIIPNLKIIITQIKRINTQKHTISALMINSLSFHYLSHINVNFPSEVQFGFIELFSKLIIMLKFPTTRPLTSSNVNSLYIRTSTKSFANDRRDKVFAAIIIWPVQISKVIKSCHNSLFVTGKWTSRQSQLNSLSESECWAVDVLKSGRLFVFIMRKFCAAKSNWDKKKNKQENIH